MSKECFIGLFDWSYLLFRKDEIERLRRDLGHMQRSNPLSQSNVISNSNRLSPPPPTNALQQPSRPAAQRDMDYVRIIFMIKHCIEILFILFLSL
jgi:hypothetical protein